ncbi:unnamed protein product, partial [marine sediment metagenome]
MIAKPELKKVDTDGDGIPDTFAMVGTKPAPAIAPAAAPRAPAVRKIPVQTIPISSITQASVGQWETL